VTRKAPIYNESHLNKTGLIIYGASVWGELAYRALETLDIKPLYFCDRSAIGKTKFGVPVIDPKELNKHKDLAVLIASADFFDEIRSYLIEIGHNLFFSIEWLLQLKIRQELLSKRAIEMLDNVYLYEEAVIGRSPEQVSIVHLGYTVTERCTLQCKDCSFLIPHYKKPENVDLIRYKPAFDRFLSVIDHISELRLYGGEPFINKDLYRIIEDYHDNEKISHISIYTNGTIEPDERNMKWLTHEKVKVRISDYGSNRNSINRLVEALEQRSISFFVRYYDEWQLGGDLRKRNYSEESLRKVYSKCFMTNCYSFLKGRLYGCPRAAHGINMNAIPDFKYDYVDFNTDEKDKRAEVLDLMRNRGFLVSCDYCDGFDNKSSGVKAGVQTCG
jgi:organic radical activating enzyme